MPLITRAIFLCNALIVSDCSSIDRIQCLVGIIVPSCFRHLQNADSIDLRENTVQLLNVMLHTDAGWQLLHDTYNAEFLAGIHDREVLLRQPLPSSVDSAERSLLEEERSHELAYLLKLRQLFSLRLPIVRYPVTQSVDREETVPSTESNDDLQKSSCCNSNNSILMLT